MRPETLAADYAALAAPLGLPERDAPELATVVDAVRAWPGGHTGWLLIFDNAGQSAAVAPSIPARAGHVLMTSRNPNWRGLGAALPVEALPPDEAAEFLWRRVGHPAHNAR